MAKVDAQLVMTLRRITDLPVSACREMLAGADGDIGEALRRLWGSPCYDLHDSNTRVAAVLASHGITWIPPERPKRFVPDAEVVSTLTFNGQAVEAYFLVRGLVCHFNTRGELMARATDDPDLSAATLEYLRRVGAREFGSFAEFQAWRFDRESNRVVTNGDS